MSKIAVGLSGGVDSAVSALILKNAGHLVTGVHLYCWPPKSEIERDGIGRAEWIRKNGCRADEDKAMALKTALELEIPFRMLDFSEEYNKRVVDYFYREYASGRTPNPDVLCNSEIKFGLFLDWAIENGFDYVATGHYARTQEIKSLRNQEVKLVIPKDKHKDQTYFLWKLTQKELNHVLFPLGNYLKSEVRAMARGAKLSVADRPDSQGICFIGNVEAREFLKRRLEEKEGKVINTEGEIIGKHKGVWFHTIGQRGGWEINPRTQKLVAKRTQYGDKTAIYYVISKDAKKNELVVGIGEETEESSFKITEVNGNLPENAMVRIRHTGKLLACKVQNGVVTLEKPQRGVAPGQSAVFYDGRGVVLGGGVIA